MIMSVYLLCLVIVSVLPAAYSLDFGAFAKCSDDCSPEKSDLECELSLGDCGRLWRPAPEGYPSFPEEFTADVRYDASDDCAPYLALSWLAPNNYGAMVLTGFRLLFAEVNTYIPPPNVCLNFVTNTWTVEQTMKRIEFKLDCVKLDPGKTYELILESEPRKPSKGTQCDTCKKRVTTEQKKKENGKCRPLPAPASSGHRTVTTSSKIPIKPYFSSRIPSTGDTPIASDRQGNTPIASASQSETNSWPISTIILVVVVAILLLLTIILLIMLMVRNKIPCLKGQSEQRHPTYLQNGLRPGDITSSKSEQSHPISLQNGLWPAETLSNTDMKSVVPPASECWSFGPGKSEQSHPISLHSGLWPGSIVSVPSDDSRWTGPAPSENSSRLEAPFANGTSSYVAPSTPHLDPPLSSRPYPVLGKMYQA